MTVRWLTILMVLVFTMPANAESRAEAMCGEDPYAQRLAELIINDPEQQRPRLRCNDTLVQVATRKAQEMAEMGLVSHLGESDPNTRLRSAGYALPTYYPLIGANQVEAVAGGSSVPANPAASVMLMKVSSARRFILVTWEIPTTVFLMSSLTSV